MTDFLSDQDIEEFFSSDNSIKGDVFVCINCGKKISLLAPGTKHRNHCPSCLYSKHVDQNVGDRKSTCDSPMKPVGKFVRPNNEEIIIHQCVKCGKVSNNRVAGDDDFDLVLRLPIIKKEQ